MVSFSESENKFILRLFQPELQLLLSETRFSDKKLTKMEGRSLKLIFPSLDYMIGDYIDNKEEGKWVLVDSLGRTRALHYYVKGLKEGPGRYFFPNGKIEKQEYYLNGKNNGKWRRYFENGKIEEEKIYSDGFQEGETKFFDSTGVLLKTEIYEKDKLVKTIIEKPQIKPADLEHGNSIEGSREPEIYTTAERNPCFLATGRSSKKDINDDAECLLTDMYRFLGENINYPKIAQQLNVSGKVFVQFVIEKDGSIGEVKLKSRLCQSLEDESIRVIKSMPKWRPGYRNGKPVRVYYNMPIIYRLD